jgi:hypothetical protein
MMKVLLGVIIVFFILATPTHAVHSWWLQPKTFDYAVLASSMDNSKLYPERNITRAFVSKDTHILFIDWENDGKEDVALMHIIMWWDDGKPVLDETLGGFFFVDFMLDVINEYKRMCSI